MNFRAKIYFVVIINLAISQFLFAQPEILWNGYIQTRLNSDFKSHNEFMIRRSKLWLSGNVPNVSNLSYKLQAVYRSHKDDTIMIQDVYAQYKAGNHKFKIGRMVPDFSLQWNQPDADIPTMERGLIVDGIIHGDNSIARMIGLQYQYNFQNNLHIGVGIFNANFSLPGKNHDKSFLYSLRSTFSFINTESVMFNFGSSFSYRKLNNITLPRIYNNNEIISGDDYRWGFESHLKINGVDFQCEFLTANINKDKAWGYYVFSNFNISEKFQQVIIFEKYADLKNTTNDNEWYGLGLNYYLTNKTKIMSDFRTQFSNNKNNYIGRIQFQEFFN